jgi:hypothetical protein
VPGTGRRRRHAPPAKRPVRKEGGGPPLIHRGGEVLEHFPAKGKPASLPGDPFPIMNAPLRLAKGNPLDRPAIRGHRRPCILPPPPSTARNQQRQGRADCRATRLTATCEIPAERVESRPFSWEDKARIGRKAIRSRKRLPDNDLPPVPYTPRHCRAGWRGHAGSAEPRERP